MRVAKLIPSVLLAATGAVAQAGRPAYMRQGKAQSITLTANVAQATVMEDGLFVGHAGAAFDSAVGAHDLIVNAPGYVPRLVRVNLVGNALVQHVNLAPVPDKNVEIEIDFSVTKTFTAKLGLEELPSLCAAYNRAPVKLSRDLVLTCRRETVIDDFAYFGKSWLVAPESPDTDATLAAKRGALTSPTASVASDPYYWQAEDLYALRPGDTHAATLLALSAVARRNCERVLQVAMEHGSYGRPSDGLIFLRGLCFEMMGQADKAARLYLHLASAKKTPAADSLYHLARVQAPVTPVSALKTLRVCTRAYPAYYPCYEAAAHVHAIGGQEKDAVRTMSLYHKRTRVALAEVLGKSDRLDPAKVAAAYAERPFSFELAAAAAIVATKTGAPLEPLPVDTTLISDPAIVRQLVPAFADLVAADVLTPVYVLLTRHYPEDPTVWIRLAGAYRVGDRCSESLEAGNKALTLIQDVRRRGALLVSSTECLVRLERLTDAEKILQTVVTNIDPGWKAYYNLGVVQERLGKTDDALRHYEMALAGDMPKAVRSRVEAKIQHYRALAEQRGAKPPGKAPTH